MDTLKTAKTKLLAANKDILEFINAFVDGKSFVETDAFMCSETEFGDAPGEGVVGGFAAIDGVSVCLFATNPAVFKGSVGALNAKKIVRAVNNAVRMSKPLVAVWDTSGARIAEGIECLDGYGDILRAFSIAYGEIPVVSIIKGANLGISSYVAGISDFVIACPDSVMATASPLVLAEKTGVKTVGTAKALAEHGIVTSIVKKDGLKAEVSKILNMFAEDDINSGDDINRVCKGLKADSSVTDIIKQVFDKDTFIPVREAYAPSVVTGLAALGGTPVGVVATDGKTDGGALNSDACIKISEFLNVCENAECPVVFLVDSVGTEKSANDHALIREMSNLIYRINQLDVDMFAVVTGKAIGSAYTALVAPCEYKIAWESASVGAIESETAARLLYADEIKSAKNKDKAVDKLAEEYSEENMSALNIARSGHFDNVIEPNLTRSYLTAALVAHME